MLLNCWSRCIQFSKLPSVTTKVIALGLLTKHYF